MATRMLCAVALMTGLAAGFGCAGGQDGTPTRPEAAPAAAPPAAAVHQAVPSTSPTAERFTGTLEGGIMAIGGETTGWRLIGEGEAGQLDVDVSAVAEAAERLRGQRVAITGRIITRNYVERGAVAVLQAQAIEPAPAPAD